MAYAVFAGDPHYHIMIDAGGPRTLCNLSTKGSRRNVREARPAGQVTREQPSPFYSLCPHSAVARTYRPDSRTDRPV